MSRLFGNRLRNTGISVAAVCCVLAASGCGTGSVGTSSGNPSTPSSTTVASAVPGDLVVSSPTAESSSATASVAKSLAKAAASVDTSDPAAGYQVKREFLQNLINSDEQCNIPPHHQEPRSPSCYGPRITYAGHADATNNPADSPNGDLPPGDLGIWNETQGDAGEACAAAQVNYLIARVASEVDRAINLFGSMACAGRLAGLELPAIGDAAVDMKQAMADRITVPGLTINSATLERQSDDASGNPVYRSTVASTVTGLDNSTREVTVTLLHVPTNDDNTTYQGRLAVLVHLANGRGGIPGNCSESGLTGTTIATVIDYSKSSETSLQYALSFGEFCGAATNPLSADLTIDASDKLERASNPDGWGNDWNYGLFQLNPSSTTGSVAYAWQAGARDGFTRVLNVGVTANSDNSASGNAYFGFGPDAAADGVGSITGFYCNWAGPNNQRIYQSLAQRQVLSRTATGTVFTASSSNITYAPANSCDASAGDGFTYFAFEGDEGSPIALNFDNDRTDDTAAVTNSLIPLSDVAFTLPEAPSGVSVE
ncbi:MAG: hypothetical protein HY696_00245 [Deltaproteobacteria bacterium]|nr:hypothetical protein [Deltaproteobacteria bacterium]